MNLSPIVKETPNNLFNKIYAPTIKDISDASPEQFIKSKKQITKAAQKRKLKMYKN
ncbi:hypothetical protein CMCT_0802 [Campylobacter mucosalis]|nr:hypothetical protein CMCT_0802 [Campylobacter mucosalis]